MSRATPAVARSRSRRTRTLSRLFLATGALLLLLVAGVRLYSIGSSRAGLDAFERARLESTRAEPISAAPELPPPRAPSAPALDGRRPSSSDRPVGILRIRRLGIEAPVWRGTDAISLQRGIGHISGTAAPGQRGNVGLAGHRDGIFAALGRIRIGDRIELESLTGVEIFTVERTLVVYPADVWVLAPTPESALTLVTCFPFVYAGSAPQRFIVRAGPIRGS